MRMIDFVVVLLSLGSGFAAGSSYEQFKASNNIVTGKAAAMKYVGRLCGGD